MDYFEKARDRSHLTPVQREYTRGGKTYTRTVYIRTDKAEGTKKEDAKAESKDKPKGDKKSSGGSIKLSDQVKEQLNKTVDELRQVAPGAKGKIRGTSVERHSNGKMFKVGDVVAHGFKAAALMVAGLEKVAASAANFGSGSLEAGRELATSPASRDVEKLGKKTLSVAAKAKEALKNK